MEDFFSIVPADLDQLIVEYQRLRPLLSELHGRIVRLAGKEDVRSCARRLGMLSRQNGSAVIAFSHELETEIFQDYLAYMHQPRGISLVQQMFNRQRALPPDSEELAMLASMVQAHFSLFWIRAIHPAGGIVALDVIRGGQFFILDQSVPQQDVVGLLTGLRIFPFLGAWMHTGISMVVGAISDEDGIQPMGQVLDRREERAMNEETIRRWRELLEEME